MIQYKNKRKGVMNKRNLFLTCSVVALSFFANGANAKSMYAHNAGAINVNMLSAQMMDFAHYGENISDVINKARQYGTMTRLDEYGDDGRRPIQTLLESTESLGKLAWADFRYLNKDTKYNDNVTRRGRDYMATIGFNTKNIELPYGGISFGAFLGNITQDLFDVTSNGFAFGAFSRYKYSIFDVTGMINNGSLNKNTDTTMFNQSWLNAAVDTSVNISLNDVLYIRPRVYFGYTHVSDNDDFGIVNNGLAPKDFEFVNLIPSVEVYTRLDRDFYASVSAKYVSTDADGDRGVYVNNVLMDKTAPQNYAEFGLSLEYDHNSWVFTGGVRKQFEGFDGWAGDVTVKYVF